jgi:S1-C subfamily serine protease
MFNENLPEKIKNARNSVIAIGFSPAPNKITITGSGFCVSSDGKILTAAHIYNQTLPQFQSELIGMAMVEQGPDGLEHYKWLPLTFIKKEDKDDTALFQINYHEKTLLKPIELGDSDKVEVGDETYFIGFPYAAQLINERFGITLIANRGMVCNVKRDGMNPKHPRNFLVIDAISNPGNSGCPLIDTGTNKVIGIMSIAFRTKSQVPKYSDLEIREPMHIAAAKPINLAKSLLTSQ